MIEEFAARFDPSIKRGEPRTRRPAGRSSRHSTRLVAPAPDEDRILRAFLAVLRATLRTNSLPARRARRVQAAHLLQARSRAIPELPEPRPMFEIFVYSPRVEGVHLRAGEGRARRTALVRSARGLPHRSAGPHEGAEGQEHGDRADRRQGRLRRQALPAGDRDACSARASPAIRRSSADCSISPTTSSTASSCRRAHVCATTMTIPTSSSRPTRAPRPSPTSPTRIRRVRLLARRRLCLGRFGGLRPQEDGHHGARRLGSREASLPRARHRHRRRRISRAIGIGDMAATCSATACCCRRTCSSSPRSTIITFSSTRARMPRAASRERERLFKLPRSTWADYDRGSSRGRRRLLATRQNHPADPQAQRCSGSTSARVTPPEVIRAILTCRPTCSGTAASART